MFLLALASLFCALIPCLLFCFNLRAYRPPVLQPDDYPAVSVLIPARNEAAGVAAALSSALGSMRVRDELVVMDDASTDGTASIVTALGEKDSRIRLERAPPLPAGWNGKQHACWALAQAACNPILCFVDADVRLGPACLPRMAGFLLSSKASLVSGFPRQLTGTTLEWLLLPLIHFVLLGFLPVGRMRRSTAPSLAAGCGQFLMCYRDHYFQTGGHSGIRFTMHDGLRLPRLFRAHGLRTDLADITGLATCRMYTSAPEVWLGLAKNATEGLAATARIVPITAILLLGQVLPFVILVSSLLLAFFLAIRARLLGIGIHLNDRRFPWTFALFAIAVIAAWLPRILAAIRFRQDWRSALLHPIGITVLLILQWYALFRKLTNRPVSWKTRAYTEG